ncbi:hypothetical protein [Nocardia sp. NPDC049707]|uniref:hypothetical protein n=1 Tax=Nocardia sp. NPDC049707 TaxID=3154735 RepID=UPI0034316739
MSIATGLPDHALSYRLPELRSPSFIEFPTGPACRFCAARRGIVEPVTIYRDSYAKLCLRHRVWVGGDNLDTQVDVSALPELTNAQRRHRNLVRHRPGYAEFVYTTAERIVSGWTARRLWGESRDRRLFTLFGDEPARFPRDSTEFNIANYPEIVSLTSILISYHWITKAVSPERTPEDLRQFYAEVRHRLGIDIGRDGFVDQHDPLTVWVEKQQHNLERNHYQRDHTQPLRQRTTPTTWQEVG